MGDDGGFGQLYLMDADGSNITQLTFYYSDGDSPIDPSHPSWSPDGSQIAFSGEDNDPNNSLVGQIWTVNADGTGESRLTTNQFPVDYSSPAWSPDGQKVVFQQLGCCVPLVNADVLVVNADGTDITRLTDNSAADFMPDWQRSSAGPSGDVVVTDCNDPQLAQLTEISGDLIIDDLPGCDAISFPLLTTVSGAIHITGTAATVIDLSSLTTVGGAIDMSHNASTTVIDLSSLVTVNGTINMADNASVTVINLSSLVTVSGAIDMADNASTNVVDISSLVSVSGSIDISATAVKFSSQVTVTGDVGIETAGTTVAMGGVTTGGNVTLTADGSDSVSAQTGGGTTDVSVLGGTASMQVVLPEGAFDQPVAFTVERQGDVPIEDGTAADGTAAQIDPLAGYQFSFAVPTLNADAQLAFTIDLAQLDDATRAALLSGVDDGSAALVVKGDEPGRRLPGVRPMHRWANAGDGRMCHCCAARRGRPAGRTSCRRSLRTLQRRRRSLLHLRSRARHGLGRHDASARHRRSGPGA